MPNMLEHFNQLESILHNQPLGLITDIDGTIAPISSDLLHTVIPPENLRALAVLSQKLALVAVVSGRGAAEVQRMINIPNVKYVGHYGLEWSENGHFTLHPAAVRYLPAVRGLVADIEILRHRDDIVFQDKGATLSLHFHRSREPEATEQLILETLHRSPHIAGLRVLVEKTGFGIVPPVDYNKGDAIAALIKEHRLRSAIFLGDDTGDVPGFRAIRASRLNPDFAGLSLLVTGKDTPPEIIQEVDYTLNGVSETTTLLQWLPDHI
ncbi:MAG: trehalose-phosphatase [Dehalococcoidales bacterium]|nr:trehalose-phosphatase [Dehalococcoidales bacterium]